jgi:hypothetical protein
MITPAAADVEIEFVDRGLLHHRHEILEQFGDALAVLGVMREVRVQEHGLGTQLVGLPQRHGRMNAVTPRLARTARHHAALVRRAADNHRTSVQRRVHQPLDGHEKRVHIQMHAARRRRSVIKHRPAPLPSPLAVGFWLLAVGFWLLAFGFWPLAFGRWLLVRLLSNQ